MKAENLFEGIPAELSEELFTAIHRKRWPSHRADCLPGPVLAGGILVRSGRA